MEVVICNELLCSRDMLTPSAHRDETKNPQTFYIFNNIFHYYSFYFIFLLNSFFETTFVTNLFQSVLAHTLVMNVKKGATLTAETYCVIGMEYVMSVLIITMEHFVIHLVLIIV